MSNIYVFIYGSLMPGFSNHHVVSSYVRSYDAGEVRGRLVDFGPYPALVRDERARQAGSLVRGLWIAVNRAGLAAMDVLEGFGGIEEANDYERIWVRDASREGLSGWVYAWRTDKGCPAVAESYWPDYLARIGSLRSGGSQAAAQ